MANIPQLYMRKQDLTVLPPISLPYGVSLHTHTTGEESSWEELIEKAFSVKYPFKNMLADWKGYKPEYVLYLAKDGKNIATASAVENSEFPNDGWLHMVGTVPEARGLGAGKTIVTAALHSFASRGFKSVVLSTDDERIAAIKLYLHLGFEPIYSHESHQERWKAVFEKINQRN